MGLEKVGVSKAEKVGEGDDRVGKGFGCWVWGIRGTEEAGPGAGEV